MSREPVNVLFSIADTGGGHRSAAIAIGAALQESLGERVEYEIIDMLQESRATVFRHSHRLYDDLSTRWLPFYNAAFRITNGKLQVETIARLVNLQARPNVVRKIRTIQPQLVVVTHPLTQRFICSARRVLRMPFRIVTVVTDLVSVHYSWIYAGVDLCLLPTDEAYELMRRRGMPTRLMARTGFPVHPKFANFTASQRDARRDLNLRNDQFTILITSGGVGSGHLRHLVSALEQAFPDKQLLVVTGKNRAVYADLRNQRRSPHTHIYGFVQNMEALMAASDVVVTKAGPGTLMEALVMRRPVIVTEAVGRQETGNIDYVVNRNLGFFCPTTPRIIAAIDSLTEHEQYRSTVTNLMDAVPSNGSAQIAHILIEQLVAMGINIDAPLRQPA